jgi:hypothetical protein
MRAHKFQFLKKNYTCIIKLQIKNETTNQFTLSPNLPAFYQPASAPNLPAPLTCQRRKTWQRWYDLAALVDLAKAS